MNLYQNTSIIIRPTNSLYAKDVMTQNDKWFLYKKLVELVLNFALIPQTVCYIKDNLEISVVSSNNLLLLFYES